MKKKIICLAIAVIAILSGIVLVNKLFFPKDKVKTSDADHSPVDDTVDDTAEDTATEGDDNNTEEAAEDSATEKEEDSSVAEKTESKTEETPDAFEPVLIGSSDNDKASYEYMDSMEFEEDCPIWVKTKKDGVAYGTVVHQTYASKTTGLERGVNILLPANYSTDKKYPVFYLLHGIFGNEHSFTGDSNMKIVEIFGNLIAEGVAEDMIVVFPDMFAKTSEDHKPGFDEASFAAYDNIINDLENDLMPFIEQNYSILTDREHQAIGGFSMGGREALYIGVTRPDLFAYCCAIAPAPGVTPGQDFAGYHKGMLQENELYVKDMDNMPYILMVCCGSKDSVVGKFPSSYHNILTTNNVNHLWYEVNGADHDNRTIQSGIYNYARYIFKAQ